MRAYISNVQIGPRIGEKRPKMTNSGANQVPPLVVHAHASRKPSRRISALCTHAYCKLHRVVAPPSTRHGAGRSAPQRRAIVTTKRVRLKGGCIGGGAYRPPDGLRSSRVIWAIVRMRNANHVDPKTAETTSARAIVKPSACRTSVHTSPVPPSSSGGWAIPANVYLPRLAKAVVYSGRVWVGGCSAVGLVHGRV